MRFRSVRQALLVCSAAVAAAALTADAAAQTAVPEGNGPGMDAHLFRPAVDSKGLFSLNGADILGHMDWSLGLIIDYGRGLLRVPDVGQRSPQLIDNAFNGTLHANLGLFHHVIVGLSFVPTLMSGEAQTSPAGAEVLPGQWSSAQVNGQYFPSHLAGHVKWRILRPERAIGVALVGQVGGNIGNSPRNLAADPGFFYWPQLAVEKSFGPPAQGRVRLTANVGYRGHTGSGTTLDLRDGTLIDDNRLTYGLGVSYRVLDSLDLVAESYATYLLSSRTADKLKPSNEVVGGIKFFVERNSYLMLGAGPRYTQGFEAADVRAFLGFIFEPSIGDRDGDGIKDDVDKCPDQPEDFDGFQDEDGCPDPDNDNDGILDVNDRCPNEPEDKDGDEDEDGCPEGGDGDRDGDGIPDSRDKCPDDPEDRDGFEDQDGCPDPDNDQDGIPDVKDKCPNDPEDKDGFEDEDGCPDPDNDKDGIPDVVDKCPNEPETYNGFEDEDGCPDKGNVIIQDNNIVILEKIQFATNSAEILPESNKILDAVATTIVHHPEFLLMEIAGHADERGDERYNLRLTQDRVNSVMTALIARGVPREKLRSKGYGEFCPEDPGHTPAAWDKNRRVDFKILKTIDGPTGVEVGCARASAAGVRPDPVP
jgi:outer membrane protein OmpA-like peptidoglycan-associated protein